MLRNIAAATDQKIVRARPALAWSFASLPAPVVTKLAALANKLGHETPLQLLQNPLQKNDLPRLGSASDEEISRAQKLQRALAASFALPTQTSMSELARVAAPHYKSEFHVAASHRQLRRLIARVLQLDAGLRNFARLGIYLPQSSARKRARSSPLAAQFDFRELDEHFTAIADRANPTVRDVAFTWRKAVEFLFAGVEAGANSQALKKALRAHLLTVAPFLAESPIAMRRNFDRKLRDADKNGIESLVDERLAPTKRRASQQLIGKYKDDLKLLTQHAVFYCRSGGISQAYRQLHDGTTHNGEQFSEEFRQAFPFSCRVAKSRVPEIVRRSVAPAVKALGPHRLGPRAVKLALPSIQRDWREVAAGDSYTSDDVTPNHYIYDWNEDGEYEFEGQRFNVMRPQFLPVVDERTDLPLGFSLIPQRTYTSWHIKTLIARVCMRTEIGLPFKQFLFEQSIWKSRNVEGLAEWTEIDDSFQRNGIALKVRHATTPKSKIIERVIGQLQNLDEYQFSYIGRGERVETFERPQKFFHSLKRAGQPRKEDVHPGEKFMSLDEYADQIEKVMLRFADEPQNGERLPGISPNEAWRQLSNGRAHRVLPESLRFLLATIEREKIVTKKGGIELRIGRLRHVYFGSDELGALIDEKVRVRFNPELPDMITVAHIATDPLALNPFSVPLFERVPAHGATEEDFARAREHQNAFASYGRAIYRELVPKFNRTLSDSRIGSDKLRAAGEAQNRLEREHIDLSARRENSRGTIRELAARQNLAIDPRKVKNPERVRRCLQSAEKAKRRIQKLERETAGNSCLEESK